MLAHTMILMCQHIARCEVHVAASWIFEVFRMYSILFSCIDALSMQFVTIALIVNHAADSGSPTKGGEEACTMEAAEERGPKDAGGCCIEGKKGNRGS